MSFKAGVPFLYVLETFSKRITQMPLLSVVGISGNAERLSAHSSLTLTHDRTTKYASFKGYEVLMNVFSVDGVPLP